MEAWMMTPEEIQEKLQNMVWSFSRVNSISQCLAGWEKQYIEEQPGVENAYAQFGTTCHETIEKFLKHELDIFSASQHYQERYGELVTCNFPPNKYVDLGEKTFNQGLQYFNNINFDFNKYEILGVEKELLFKVGKYPFKGYADAIYRDKETGEIILRDHKTSSFKYLIDGSVSSVNMEHFTSFKRQEYLYCIPLIEIYGKVDKLTWNMIRDQKIIEIPFKEDEFKEAQEWAIKNIETVMNEVLWLPDNSNTFFCNHLCSQRNSCMYRQ